VKVAPTYPDRPQFTPWYEPLYLEVGIWELGCDAVHVYVMSEAFGEFPGAKKGREAFAPRPWNFPWPLLEDISDRELDVAAIVCLADDAAKASGGNVP
jgi:hypothetical protein